MMYPPPELETYTKETVMESLNLLGLALAFLFGLFVGWWSYRYTLKRDPAKLEELAKKINAQTDKVGK